MKVSIMHNKYFKILTWTLTISVFIASTTTIASLISTGFHNKIFSKEFCLENSCLQYFNEMFSSSIEIFTGSLEALSFIATTGGILVALQSYITSSQASTIANHISHFSIFQTFISNEVCKRDRISIYSIDVFAWYQAIFPNSRNGEISACDKYKEQISNISSEINISNKQTTTPSREGFRYKEHQDRMISCLSPIGIGISRATRNGYFEIEDQVISLINSVHRAFCSGDDIPEIPKRLYI